MKELIFVLAFIGSFLICSWLLLNSHKIFAKHKNTCNKCWRGEMIKIHNSAILTSPPKYPYVCDRCGHREYRLK